MVGKQGVGPAEMSMHGLEAEVWENTQTGNTWGCRAQKGKRGSLHEVLWLGQNVAIGRGRISVSLVQCS